MNTKSDNLLKLIAESRPTKIVVEVKNGKLNVGKKPMQLFSKSSKLQKIDSETGRPVLMTQEERSNRSKSAKKVAADPMTKLRKDINKHHR